MLQFQHIHFIGIGGAGMSAIASIVHHRGIRVSGSDLRHSRYSRPLEEAGIPVLIGQVADNITDDIDLVVVSTAIRDNNPELVEARRRGIEVWHRTRMLGELTAGYETVAAAGTHGKTTTSSLVGHALSVLGGDPTFLIGGILEDYGSNARCGSGPYFVAEADESDESFLAFRSRVAIVTNVEADHLDHYGSMDDIRHAFGQFMANVCEDGCAVVCAHTPGLVELAQASTDQVISYGFDEGVDYRVLPGQGGDFSVLLPDGASVQMRLPSNPGRHNMLNATAALAALVFLGFPAPQAAEALSSFRGVHRRFTCVGQADGVTVIDDYGHHPTEIAATIAAAQSLGYKRVHVLFQPHRYSRTKALIDGFASCFDGADTLTLMDVYAAGEMPIPGVNGKSIVDAVRAHNPELPLRWVPHRPDTVAAVMEVLEPGDMLLMSGAGDVNALGRVFLDELEKREACR